MASGHHSHRLFHHWVAFTLIFVLLGTFIAVPFLQSGISGEVVRTVNDSFTSGPGETDYQELLHRLYSEMGHANYSKEQKQYIRQLIAAHGFDVAEYREKELYRMEKIAAEHGLNLPQASQSRRSYIVSFEADALLDDASAPAPAVTGMAASESRVERIRSLHEKARKDLVQVTGRYRHAAFSSKTTPVQTFSRVFNGMAVRLTPHEASRLKSRSYVEDISVDRNVTLLLSGSKGEIGGERAWKQLDEEGYNITGKDISIAVIDTGIDYTHPAFGNCSSDEFMDGQCDKVIDGHDFVNEDNDPMDDNGHGTHCAGIAAGDGRLMGVAPDAKLVGYKVLDSGGSGKTSDIIAAIERAVDPNMDFNTSDHYDIISMSLGGTGEPGDELTQAVRKASRAGVVSVIAAGNDGPLYRSVSSPACEPTAITVGASCQPDQIQDHEYCKGPIAEFSSRGPSHGHNKPEVVAPGVKICAAQAEASHGEDDCPEGYIAHSGTSMATPHVAGAVALLKQEHPGWTPEEMKNALMGTADGLNASAVAQGAGEVNITSALQMPEEPPVANIKRLSNITFEE